LGGFEPSVLMEAVMNRISKSVVAGLASLTMAAAVVLPATPAAAQWRGGWHGGGGGWHGGGWHGGGWGGGWRGGWAGGRTWHPGYWRGGYWYNGWWGPAVAAGVLAGAAIATYPSWGGYGYDYGGGCWQYRPTYDGYGNYRDRST
jgi:hypothetical protein